MKWLLAVLWCILLTANAGAQVGTMEGWATQQAQLPPVEAQTNADMSSTDLPASVVSDDTAGLESADSSTDAGDAPRYAVTQCVRHAAWNGQAGPALVSHQPMTPRRPPRTA